MLSKEIEKELNEHLNFELASSYLYLSMSSWFETQGLSGFAHWMRVQTQEELVHVQKFYTYIYEKNAAVLLSAIEAPQSCWVSTLRLFEDALTHEELVTKRINHFMTLAIKKMDHATVNFLNWFVDEQVEEEASIRKVIDELKLIGDKGQGLFLLNREFAQRTLPVPPGI